MARVSQETYDQRLKLYDQLVDSMPEVQRKGKTMPYTSVNGHMFSLFTGEAELAIRLPSADREQFLEDYDTELCVQYGSVMKEYALVPASLLEQTEKLLEYFKLSYDYTKSLKPK